MDLLPQDHQRRVSGLSPLCWEAQIAKVAACIGKLLCMDCQEVPLETNFEVKSTDIRDLGDVNEHAKRLTDCAGAKC